MRRSACIQEYIHTLYSYAVIERISTDPPHCDEPDKDGESKGFAIIAVAMFGLTAMVILLTPMTTAAGIFLELLLLQS